IRRGPVLRASYGIYYDRPFDNLWQNLRSNSVEIASVTLSGFGQDYLRPVQTILSSATRPLRSSFQEPLIYQDGIRDAYSQSYLVGFASTWKDFWHWEVNHLGSFGRKLITTDRIGRASTLLAYRANQGSSNFAGLNLVLRRRTAPLLLEVSY